MTWLSVVLSVAVGCSLGSSLRMVGALSSMLSGPFDVSVSWSPSSRRKVAVTRCKSSSMAWVTVRSKRMLSPAVYSGTTASLSKPASFSLTAEQPGPESLRPFGFQLRPQPLPLLPQFPGLLLERGLRPPGELQPRPQVGGLGAPLDHPG